MTMKYKKHKQHNVFHSVLLLADQMAGCSLQDPFTANTPASRRWISSLSPSLSLSQENTDNQTFTVFYFLMLLLSYKSALSFCNIKHHFFAPLRQMVLFFLYENSSSLSFFIQKTNFFLLHKPLTLLHYLCYVAHMTLVIAQIE